MLSSWLMIFVTLATRKGKVSRAEKRMTYTPQFYNLDSSPKASVSGSPGPRLLNQIAVVNQKRKTSSRAMSSSATPSNSRDSSCKSDSSTRLPRSGHVVVLVGSERKRFIIPINIHNHRLFKLLVEKLGSSDCCNDETDAILLHCDTDFLHRVLFLIDRWGDSNEEMRWDELKKFLEGNVQ